MNRYCSNCQMNYEIPSIKKMSDLNNVVCPVCGQKIPANSKKPQPPGGFTDSELFWANLIQTLYNMSFLFYLAMGIIGIEGYFFHFDTLLYVATALAVIVYIIQVATRTAFFRTGVIFLPLGAIAGAVFFRTPQGACLGICVVFVARHLIRDVLWRLIWKLIDLINRKTHS